MIFTKLAFSMCMAYFASISWKFLECAFMFSWNMRWCLWRASSSSYCTLCFLPSRHEVEYGYKYGCLFSFFFFLFLRWGVFYFIFHFLFKYKFIYFNWRLITLQYCIGFAIHQHEGPPFFTKANSICFTFLLLK